VSVSAGFRKTVVTLGLITSSAAMVYGTWIAADDMRAKPLVAKVSAGDGRVRVENHSGFTWQAVRLTVNGRYADAGPRDGAVAPGAVLDIDPRTLRDAAGATFPGEAVRELTISVRRVPRFPALNRERTASGTFTPQ